MKRPWHLSRRFLLRGLGASLALPLLDAMEPTIKKARAQGEAAPSRWVLWHFPSGYNDRLWVPEGPGEGETDWPLSPALEPLGELGIKGDVSVVTGLSAPYADGRGASHTCGISGQLSGFLCPNEVSENRTTIDQGIAGLISKDTKFPSLQLGTAILHENPNDEPGYSANIKDHLSWKNSTTPLPKEVNPGRVFQRLFGDEVDISEDAIALQRRERTRRSILDTVLDEADGLEGKIGRNDREKIDQYLESVREIERAIQVAPRNNDSGMCDAQGRVGTFGTPDDIQLHVAQMNQLMALALRCDITRVVVFQYETTVTSILHPFLDVRAPFHLGVAHHGRDDLKLEYYFKVNRWLVSQFGEFVKLLKDSPDGDGVSLLDHSAVVMTSELGDGDAHNHVNLPCLVAGNAGGQLGPGRFLERDDQFMRLLISTAQAVGADIDGWGTDYNSADGGPIRGALPGFLGS